MLVLVDSNDARAVRNKDTVLAMYELLINTRKPMDVGAKLLGKVYIQHNPLLENDRGQFQRHVLISVAPSPG